MMNRREVIESLLTLPGLTRIAVADLKPADVIVVEVEGVLTERAKENVRTILEQVWPGHRVVVCDGGMHLKVIPGE